MPSPAAHSDNTGRWGTSPLPWSGGERGTVACKDPRGQFYTTTEERGTLASHLRLLCLSFLPRRPRVNPHKALGKEPKLVSANVTAMA